MSKIIAFVTGIYNFIRFDIWRITEYELSRTRRSSYRLVKTVVLAVRGFGNDDLNVKASALTYSILFAVVPLFALIIAVAKGFGVEKMIENSLQETFIAQANMIPTVMGFVERYLETTQGGLFIGIGIAILLWSVMSFFMQVEDAFKSIWQVKKSRSVLKQFTTYFSAILIIPFLIVLSSGLSIYVNTALSQSFFLRYSIAFNPFCGSNFPLFYLLGTFYRYVHGHSKYPCTVW
jgi:membrane protein